MLHLKKLVTKNNKTSYKNQSLFHKKLKMRYPGQKKNIKEFYRINFIVLYYMSIDLNHIRYGQKLWYQIFIQILK